LPGPAQGVGILLPGLVPAAAAARLALIFVRRDAAPLAYVAGVAGPLIGADMLHVRQIEQSAVGWLVLAAPERSMVSSFRALSPPIWHDVRRASGPEPQSSLPAGLPQTVQHMGVVLRPMPRHPLRDAHVERGRRNCDSLFQRFFRFCGPTKLAECRGKPAIRQRAPCNNRQCSNVN
jgi:Protein of unknown function (DUF1614)